MKTKCPFCPRTEYINFQMFWHIILCHTGQFTSNFPNTDKMKKPTRKDFVKLVKRIKTDNRIKAKEIFRK